MKEIDEKKSNKRFLIVSDKMEDASIAWLKDEIHILELMRTFNKKTWGSSIYSKLAVSIRQAYRKGKIKYIK